MLKSIKVEKIIDNETPNSTSEFQNARDSAITEISKAYTEANNRIILEGLKLKGVDLPRIEDIKKLLEAKQIKLNSIDFGHLGFRILYIDNKPFLKIWDIVGGLKWDYSEQSTKVTAELKYEFL